MAELLGSSLDVFSVVGCSQAHSEIHQRRPGSSLVRLATLGHWKNEHWTMAVVHRRHRSPMTNLSVHVNPFGFWAHLANARWLTVATKLPATHSLTHTHAEKKHCSAHAINYHCYNWQSHCRRVHFLCRKRVATVSCNWSARGQQQPPLSTWHKADWPIQLPIIQLFVHFFIISHCMAKMSCPLLWLQWYHCALHLNGLLWQQSMIRWRWLTTAQQEPTLITLNEQHFQMHLFCLTVDGCICWLSKCHPSWNTLTFLN